MEQKRIAVLLVNYNGESCLRDCLESLKDQNYQPLDIFIVDNASTDKSIALIEREYQFVTLIKMQKNIGFGCGNNIGIKAAMERGVDYILFLNPDTIVENNMVSELMKYADEFTVVAPKIIYKNDEDEKEHLWYAGGWIDEETGDIEHLLYEDSLDMSPQRINYISGCCMLLPVEVFKNNVFFDDHYFLYYEDVDFCMQLKQRGFHMLYVPTACLKHQVGGSVGGEMSSTSQYYGKRNLFYFMEKYASEFSGKYTIQFLKDFIKEQGYLKKTNQYKPYYIAAIMDFLESNMGQGYYGKKMLNEHYLMSYGYYHLEQDGENFWYWASNRKTRILILNPSKATQIYSVTFSLLPPPNREKRAMKIWLDEEVYKNVEAPHDIHIQILMKPEETKLLEIETEEELVGLEERSDERRFAFQLVNFCIEEHLFVEKYFVLNGYYGLEKDRDNSWYWASHKKPQILLLNLSKVVKIYTVAFSLSPPPGREWCAIKIWLDEEVYMNVEAPYDMCMQILMKPEETKLLEIETKEELVSLEDGADERKFAFQLVNLFIEEQDAEE